jgi:Phage shock protein A (IM30), suppresses sigma54-dependent transcription
VEWMRRAELAVEKHQEDLARPALERTLSYRQMAESFGQQLGDQKVQVENLKSALHKLEQKLAEAQSKCDLLVAQHRRARALERATDAQGTLGDSSHSAAFDRMKNKVLRSEAISQAKAELSGNTVQDRLLALGREEEIDRLLEEMKARRRAS